MPEITAEYIIKRRDYMKGKMATWLEHYQDLADHYMPRKSNITTTWEKGAKRTEQLYDSTGVLANQYMAAGLFTWLCPLTERWFSLQPRGGAEISDDAKWELFRKTTLILQQLEYSNLGLVLHEFFLDLCCFGTANIRLERAKSSIDYNSALLFSNLNIGEYFVTENSQGIIDTAFRTFEYTVRQAVEDFGIENVSREIREDYNSDEAGKRDKTYEFIHAVFPRKEYDASKKDAANRPIASVYVDVKAKLMVEQDGYYEMPIFVVRYEKSTGEVPGRSPAMIVLPETKMLQKMVRTTIVGAEKVVDPPILAPDDGFVGTVRTTPASIMYYRVGLSGSEKPEAFKSSADIGLGLEMEESRRDTIRKAFYNDLFLMLSSKPKTRTATEVMEMVEEKLVILGSTIGRIELELFNPKIRRSIAILTRAGILPPFSDEILDVGYEINFVSRLAMAMKLREIISTNNVFASLAPLLAVKEDMLDNFDTDEIARGTAYRRGMPAEFVRSVSDRDSIRQQREEMMRQQAALEQMQQAAEAVPKLSKPIEEGSALKELMGAAG